MSPCSGAPGRRAASAGSAPSRARSRLPPCRRPPSRTTGSARGGGRLIRTTEPARRLLRRAPRPRSRAPPGLSASRRARVHTDRGALERGEATVCPSAAGRRGPPDGQAVDHRRQLQHAARRAVDVAQDQGAGPVGRVGAEGARAPGDRTGARGPRRARDRDSRRGPSQWWGRRHPMAKLIYSAITSLDGYVGRSRRRLRLGGARRGGARVRQRARAADRHLSLRPPHVRGDALLGDRRPRRPPPGGARDFATIWQAADKVVYSPDAASRTQRADADRARLRPRGDPADEGFLRRDISVGGPALAAQALAAGLVDELHLFVTPVIVGGGSAIPARTTCSCGSSCSDERRFGNGVVHLHYRTRA